MSIASLHHSHSKQMSPFLAAGAKDGASGEGSVAKKDVLHGQQAMHGSRQRLVLYKSRERKILVSLESTVEGSQ
jgi:hypothetical protein